MWTEKHPVGFQYWKNIHLKNKTYYFYHISFNSTILFTHFGATYGPIDIQHIKSKSIFTLYPELSFDNDVPSCTALLTENLADPEWVTIDCFSRISTDILCQYDGVQGIAISHENLTRSSSTKLFSTDCIFRNNLCHIFQWFVLYNNGSETQIAKFISYHVQFQTNEMRDRIKKYQYYFSFLFLAVGTQFLPILVSDRAIVTFRVCEGFFDFLMSDAKSTSQNQALRITTKGWVTFVRRGNVFTCEKGNVISTASICDHLSDCSYLDLSDESGCSCNETEQVNQAMCKYVLSKENQKSCSPFYLKTFDNRCVMFFLAHQKHNEVHPKATQNGNMFKCQNGTNIKPNLVNDLVADCGTGAEDENILFTPQSMENVICSGNYHLSCRRGHSKCYKISDICAYRLDSLNNLIPCRTGEHLENCRNFQCNMMYKCPHFYCIPWKYVCDGKWDCPFGMDEEQYCDSNIQTVCLSMFRCKLSSLCIHLNNLCDEEENCPQGDDELMCSLSKADCLSECDCLAYIMRCLKVEEGVHLSTHLHVLPYHVMHIFDCHESFVLNLFSFSHNVLAIHANNNSLTNVCQKMQNSMVVSHIDFSKNKITKIETGCFQQAQGVTVLKLRRNRIAVLEKNSLVNLKYLSILDVSHNELKTFCENIGLNVEMEMLFLQQNNIEVLQLNTFKNVDLTLLESDRFEVCCSKPSKARCSAQKPWYKSCSNLLINSKTKVTFCCVSFSVITLNIISSYICFNLYLKSLQIYSLLATSINMSDMLYGTYMTILWSADFHYGDVFIFYEKQWKSGITCFAAFSIVIFFSYTTAFLLSLLSFLRFFAVAFPIKIKTVANSSVKKLIFLMCIISLALSISFSLSLKLLHHEIPFHLCFPFLDPDKSADVVKLYTWGTVLFQLACSMFIIFMHVLLAKEILSGSEMILQQKNNKVNSGPIFLQLVFVSVSNLLCWIPSGIIFIVSFFLHKYPISMVVWTILVLSPINSIVNPCAFVCLELKSKLKRAR